ncbi:MAG: hypothetical protein U0905_06005 [Pirellulales bacterium]
MAPKNTRYEVVARRSKRESLQLWPMDAALLVISCLIMVLVLKYLRFNDSRLAYNAWTYLIGVPSVMIILAMILHLTTGKVVGRSMQLSFLVSVAVHLLILVSTLNVLIFAKYWPDVYDEMVAETRPQKSTAAEYHRPVLAVKKSRPNYLRAVPVEHESEEKPTPRARREQLADLKPVEMPTDRSRTETPEPFLIPNPKPSPNQPVPNSSAVELERKRLQADYPRRVEKIDVPEPTVEVQPREALEARETTTSRTAETQRETASSVAQALAAETSPSVSVEAKPIPRARREQNPDIRDVQSSLPQRTKPSDLLMERPRMTQIPLPEAALSEPGGSELATVEARQQNVVKRSSSAPTQSQSEKMQDRPTTPSQLADRRSDIMRSNQGRAAMESLPGDVRESTPRRVQGGPVARELASSETLKGPTAPESHATTTNQPNASELASSLKANQSTRPSFANRSSSLSSAPRDSLQLPNLGRSQNGASSNIEGLSAAQTNESGAAMELANALGQGDRGTETRNRSGMASELAGPVVDTKIGFAEGVSGASSNEPLSPGLESRPLGSGRGQAARGLSQGRDNLLSAPSAMGSIANPLGDGSGREGNGLNARRGNEDWIRDLEASSDRQASGRAQTGRRDGLSLEGAESGSLYGPLKSSAIPVPNEEGQGRGNVPSEGSPDVSSLADRVQSPSRTSDRSSIASNLGMAKEDGGPTVALERGQGGLERRPLDRSLADVGVSDIQIQRFRRKDLGGPTLSGEGVPIPAPAFQRRLDRNRDPGESDSSGAIGPEAERTIERGLAFLAAHQRSDGSWRLEDFDTPVQIRSNTAATALAILAFQGAGYTHQQDKYAGTVARGLQYLIRSQRENGDLYVRMDNVSDMNAWLYSHSIASLALCESYGMTQDPQLQKPAQRAVDFMIASQDKSGGGWRYTPGLGSDTSVTGWFMMALKSAQLAGLEVDPTVFQGIQRWLDNSQASRQEKHLYRYNYKAPDTDTQRHGREVTPIMTSIGLLMRLYLGWQREDGAMQEGAQYLLQFPPAEGDAQTPLRDTYYWYYATQVMFHMGGDTWKEWNSRLRPILIESQVESGEYAGSWEPLGDIPDAWGSFGGRLYVTTLNLLSLEVYYRHLPLYEATAK